ncbi:IS30 family transposase [Methyloglobulus sp.]|uniref:IS30 family transposase n=1 Tax=Methyloglobulus sp. TaxID=2518622 RepID=UPI00398A02FC
MATLYKHLRQSNKKRKKQYASKDRCGQVRNRIGIDERPAIVAEKTRIGATRQLSWIGQDYQGALVTIMDRASKFTLIQKVDSKQAEVVTAATIVLLQPYLDKALTITTNNGKEFAGHEIIKERLNADVYFAHPYRS